MPEVTRKRTGELIRKLFDILVPEPDGLPAREALDLLRNQVQLTEYEKGNYQSGSQRFEHIVRFATIDCVKAGWLIKQKGKWTITDEGKKAYQAIQDPEAFYRKAVKLYHEWKASQPGGEPETENELEDSSSSKTASITFEQAEEQAWSEIEHYLREMKPYDFQELVACLLRAMGYHVSWISPPGKDGGIDIVAWSDPLGTRPPRIKVQVKRIGENVNVGGLRSFMAVLGEDDVGIFVTTSGFTKDAEDEARTQEKRKITLINLEKLFDLWVQHYGRLDDEARRRLPLRPIHFLAPET
ncbi:MAG TPA: restriction endonuclease [Gemmatales bacterium]|nr:restriction endonuclease [Gemmatales bacterium]